MELLLNNKLLQKKNCKEQLLIMKTLTTHSMENSLLIYNKLEQVVTTHLPQLTPKLSTGEEMTLFKKEMLLLEEMMDGHPPIILTGI